MDNDETMFFRKQKEENSESTKEINSPVTCFMPAFLAADKPPFFWVTILKRLSFFAYLDKIWPEKSVDPSLTQMISKFW